MVYCGGLENRCGITPTGGSNPSLSARKNFVSNLNILFWVITVAVVFGLLWWQGKIAQFAGYVRETRVELEKCSWPTWEELKGSTVLVFISIVILGLFTVVIDFILLQVFIKL